MSILPDLKARIEAFIRLGEKISTLEEESRFSLFRKMENQNAWFVARSAEATLEGLAFMLSRENLDKWLANYSIQEPNQPRKIGILMAGNIPAVGFHDLMCVVISGHKACVKLSSSDAVLMDWLIQQLFLIESRFKDLVQVEEMLKAKDAYIATGSDNSARYFNYYFGKYPHIIRSNRTSIAILTGMESDHDLENLGKDIFQYFGLGCRNVSKIYVKSESSLQHLLRVLERNQWVNSHHKYLNNYDYNKSIYLVNGEPHLDNGLLILKESKELVSPIGVLYYEYYEDILVLTERLNDVVQKIQCVVSSRPVEGFKIIPFGQAQLPCPWDYADNLDTLQFLLNLNLPKD